jgi:hypothetical protein
LSTTNKPEKGKQQLPITLHQSLISYGPYQGRKLEVHLVCQTKIGGVLMVHREGEWCLPSRLIEAVGTLILLPDKIIKDQLGCDPVTLRGGNPACGDTKIVAEHEDSDGSIHVVLRVNIFHVRQRNFEYFSGFRGVGQDEFSKLTIIALEKLGWKQPEHAAIAEKIAA